MAADGGGQRLLVPGAIVNGELSPDGRRLAVVEKLGDDVAVVVMRPDGSDRRVLLRRPAPPWA